MGEPELMLRVAELEKVKISILRWYSAKLLKRTDLPMRTRQSNSIDMSWRIRIRLWIRRSSIFNKDRNN